ncbi:MAG: DUF2480 family protein [Saprospiraceae bacterium]|nr:DUF2480 family protein [Saprospiraceae bacterium]
MQEILVNKVAQSGLITIKLEDWFPKQDMLELDIKQFLFHGLILKEKDYRESMAQLDWSQYQDKVLCVYCSTDAIIPVWAYMLIAVHSEAFVDSVYFGTKESYIRHYYSIQIGQLDVTPYVEGRLVIKGCGDLPVPASAYMDLTARLVPVAKSIFYGEPCSTVPVFKQKKNI